MDDFDKEYPPDFKRKVVLEALKGSRTHAELAEFFKISVKEIARWKKTALAAIDAALAGDDDGESEPYEELDRLPAERDFR